MPDLTSIKEFLTKYRTPTKEFLEIAAIVIAVGWFFFGWGFRNILDGSVEFTVEVNTISTDASSKERTVELAANLHNQTGIAFKIERIAWYTANDLKARPKTPITEHQWETPYGCNSFLIRNGNWRLVATTQIPMHKPVILFAECQIDLQDKAKTLYFQKVIPTDISREQLRDQCGSP